MIDAELPEGNRRYIAVVDDEAPVLVALRRVLDSLGFSVEAFASGPAFLADVARRRPDCVVLDLHMPELDGLDVLRKLGDALPRVPVVVLTGRDTPESREQAERLHASAFLRKPVGDEELLAAIHASIKSA